jgi:hypothetical protein
LRVTVPAVGEGAAPQRGLNATAGHQGGSALLYSAS